MAESEKGGLPGESENKETEQRPAEETGEGPADIEALKKSLAEAGDKYIRLYAEFENYKKIAGRSREEQLKYANEGLIKDLLTVIDHLELALHHASNDGAPNPLAEGVGLTLKELKTVLEKYGLSGIDALGKPFDPSFHHAMSQIESEDAEDNTVVREFRKGYIFKDRVIRATLAGVAKKQNQNSKRDAQNHFQKSEDN